MPTGSKTLRWALVALTLQGLGGCMRAAPPLPSFSREHQKATESQSEALQSALEAVERCVDASQGDVTDTQLRHRMQLLCRQAERIATPVIASQEDLSSTSLVGLSDLRVALSNPQRHQDARATAIAALEISLDRLHAFNDPLLLASLAQHAPRWHVAGMKLRLSLRVWRRCVQDQAKRGGSCTSHAQQCRRDLEAFDATLAALVADPPFGARSFRRCARRPFLSQPPQPSRVARIAPDSPGALRSCERMATRIRWAPI